MRYPCNIILPEPQTSAGLDGRSFWVGAAEGTPYWIGWYRKQSSTDQICIIKFEFENYVGDCF